MAEKDVIGEVTHYFPKISVGIIKLHKDLCVGELIGFGAKENKRVKFAVVRELHIYGQAINLGEKGLNKREGYAKETAGVLAQHKGIGKVLMEKAEEITRKNKIKKLSVISGIGVREYYRKLGYKLEGFYMVKKI